MFCEKCGNQVPENSRFCPSCGTVLNWKNESPKSPQKRYTPETPTVPANSLKKRILLLTLGGGIISVICGIMLGTLLWLHESSKSDEADMKKTETAAPAEQKTAETSKTEGQQTTEIDRTEELQKPVSETTAPPAVSETPVSLPQPQIQKMVGLLDHLHQSLLFDGDHQHNIGMNYNVDSKELKPSHKAHVLWVYECLYQDSRVTPDTSAGPFNSRNKARKTDMRNIMSEIFGTATDADMQEFINLYTYEQDSDFYYMSDGTGDFGSAELTYFDSENITATMENGRLKISGTVMKYDFSVSGDPAPFKTFTGYYIPSSGTALEGYCLDQLVVQ